MRNALLTVIALLLVVGLAFGIFAYFDTRDNLGDSQKKVSQSNKKSNEDNKNNESDNNNQNSDQQNQSDEDQVTTKSERQNDIPSMVEVMTMVDQGKDVSGIVDSEGNTWSTNPGKTVTYTNSSGESYTSSLNYDGELDGVDFDRTYDEDDESPIEYAEEPDPEVIQELQDEIDNAGLQSERDSKQEELDTYIESFN